MTSCSNGARLRRGIDTGAEDWRTIIDINLMAHVFAARSLVRMVARGSGYLVRLPPQASISDWLRHLRGHQARCGFLANGSRLPMGMRDYWFPCSSPGGGYAMIAGTEQGGVASVDGIMAPETVADVVVFGPSAFSSFLTRR